MKLDKKHLLDDSVKYLGKQIDPYTVQHKRNANFFREILLKDAGIIPESRELKPLHNINEINDKLCAPKSARVLFNA